MHKYIIYTTEGYTSGPNTDIVVENCQVLGIIDGCSEEDAITKLFRQNEWILKAGFTVGNAIVHPLLTSY